MGDERSDRISQKREMHAQEGRERPVYFPQGKLYNSSITEEKEDKLPFFLPCFQPDTIITKERLSFPLCCFSWLFYRDHKNIQISSLCILIINPRIVYEF